MNIYPLLEGTFAVSKQKEFVYLNEIDKKTNGLILNIRPFLIETDDDLILIDCGIGARNELNSYLITKLNASGFSENKITKILISHLHKDHVNGLGYFEEDKFIANFPNAKIYIQEKEMNYALNQNSPSYDTKYLNAIKQLPNVIFLNEYSGKINDQIRFEIVGGHVPFQQVFWISENDEIAFYGADNLPQQSYLKYHAAFKNDLDGVKAMNYRIEWEEFAKKEHWTILFYHGKKTGLKKF